MYENYKIYGPYKSKKDNRLRCVLVSKIDNSKITISYPKYIMEIYLNRYLEKDETIDHIDCNPLNNDISNLRVINRADHTKQDSFVNKDIKVRCSYCGKEFVIKGSEIHHRNRKDRQSRYYCSKVCIGKYGAAIQNHKITPIIRDIIIPSKYRVKSALFGNNNVEVG